MIIYPDVIFMGSRTIASQNCYLFSINDKFNYYGAVSPKFKLKDYRLQRRLMLKLIMDQESIP